MERITLSYLKLSIFFYFLTYLSTVLIYAQNRLPKIVLPQDLGIYMELNYQQQQRKGIVRYMTFHDHDPKHLQSNPNFVAHRHQYYKPFTQSTERFHQLQFVGQYALNKRTIIRAVIPYWQKQRIEESDFESQVTKKRAGIGDIWVQGKYQLFNSNLVQLNNNIQHIFWIGAGIKAPTGRGDHFDALNELEPKLEVGTGSWDFLGSLDYWWNYQYLQIEANATYQYNGKSRYTYQFGNAIHGQLKASYYWQWNNWVIQPHLQASVYYKTADEMNGRVVTLEDTERTIGFGGIGSAMGYRNIKLHFQYQHPIRERLAELQMETQGQWQIGLQYRLGSDE